jgi:hypothetical protein
MEIEMSQFFIKLTNTAIMDTDIHVFADTELNGLSVALPKLLRTYGYIFDICNLSVCLWYPLFL